jgi:hypothetical protein
VTQPGTRFIFWDLLDDLTLRILGPQFRGGNNTQFGWQANQAVFLLIKSMVVPPPWVGPTGLGKYLLYGVDLGLRAGRSAPGWHEAGFQPCQISVLFENAAATSLCRRSPKCWFNE